MYAERRMNRSALLFWHKRTQSKLDFDKKKLKELYTALAQLTEEECTFLYKKYFHKNKNPSDKVLAEQYGMTRYEYRKARISIEDKLYKLLEDVEDGK